MNYPPFYVGQKIIRTGHSVTGIVEHGKIYTTNKCFQCPGCSDWKVNCVEFPLADANAIEGPCSCGSNFPTLPLLVGRAKYFSPVQENFQSITLEKVLEEETKLISVN